MLAEQMRTNIEKKVSNNEMKIIVSGGMAFSEDGGDVFRKADSLLYEAKKLGKNRIIFEESK